MGKGLSEVRGKGTKLGEGIRDFYIRYFYADLWFSLGFLLSGFLHSGLFHSGKVCGAILELVFQDLTRFEDLIE